MSNAQMSIVLFRVTSLIIDIEAGNVNWVPGGGEVDVNGGSMGRLMGSLMNSLSGSRGTSRGFLGAKHAEPGGPWRSTPKLVGPLMIYETVKVI